MGGEFAESLLFFAHPSYTRSRFRLGVMKLIIGTCAERVIVDPALSEIMLTLVLNINNTANVPSAERTKLISIHFLSHHLVELITINYAYKRYSPESCHPMKAHAHFPKLVAYSATPPRDFQRIVADRSSKVEHPSMFVCNVYPKIRQCQITSLCQRRYLHTKLLPPFTMYEHTSLYGSANICK